MRSITHCCSHAPLWRKSDAANLLTAMLQKLTLLFPLWMILSGATALLWPGWLMPLNHGSVIVLLLAFIMLCMGLTLELPQ